MAGNSLYPGFWKINYTANAHSHTMIVPVKPVNVSGTWLFQDKSGNVTNNLLAAATAFCNLLKPFLKTTDAFNYAELWTLASEDADPIFIEVQSLAIAGTSASANVPRSQFVMTFRTVAGGLWRLYIMEGWQAFDTLARAPFPAGADKTLSDALIAGTSFVYGRDGSYLAAPISAITKENDALRKKYLLNV